MGFFSSKDSEISNNHGSNIYDLQKSKRGDIWFLLTFLIPLSIMPAKVYLGGNSQTYLMLNWIFMQIDLSSMNISFFYPFYPIYTLGQDLFYNLVFLIEIILLICSLFIYFNKIAIKLRYWKKIVPISVHFFISKEKEYDESFLKNIFFLFIFFQFLRYWFYMSLPGQTFYNIAMLVQAYLILLAVVIRLKQYNDKRNGKLVESGIIGLIAALIVFLQIIRFIFSQLFISEFYLETHSEQWNASGVTVVNTLIKPLLLFPFPFLTDMLSILGFNNVSYPFTYSLVLFSIPIGIFIPLIWAYKEYRAFPNAFGYYMVKFLRTSIIFLFVIVSIFPLIYMILVSFNDNRLLKVGLPIWPFNPSASFITTSWESFARFVVNPGYTPEESILFTLLTLIFILFALLCIVKRKSISGFFEQILGENYREMIINLSWLVIIILQILFLNILIYLLVEINKIIRYNVNESNIIRIVLETLNNILVISYGGLVINYVLVGITILYLFLFFLVFLFTKGKIWLLLSKAKTVSKIFNLIAVFLYIILFLAILLTNLFVLFFSEVRFVVDSSFQDILWFDIAFIIISLFLIATFLHRRRISLIDNFEGFYLEDGFAFTLALISFVFALIFGVLADNAYNWMYFQSDTHILFPVGDWFFITISLCTVVSLFSIVLASLSGYALSRYRFYGRGLIGGMILSTQIFPGVILVLPMLIIFNVLGLTGSLFGLGVAYSVIALPFVTYLLKGFFDSIPVDLEEQAMIDGCTRMQAYRKVVLPLVLPGIASTFIFSFLAMYTEYLFALVIYMGKISNYTISLAMLKVFQADLTQRGVYYNDMAVFAVLVSLPVLFMFTYLQRYLLKGLVAGGTKG